ncbi:MAG TPA: TetR/AcrR family transcriptional regulator [Anaeromyxobacteraceae bacterium]|nr:TetR/AcrR family transcriptional regulator [Anaeromyxobacteraceae bacterium]
MLRNERGHKGAPRRAGLRERNKERKREALVRAGRALFLAKGFEETTTRAIAAKAGVASGTFFLYFREKRELLFHLFQEEVSRVQAEAFASAPADAPLVARLCHVFGRFYAHYARNPRLSRVFLKELVFLEEGESAPMMSFTMGFVVQLAEAVADAKERGEVRASVDALQVAAHAMALYLFGLVAWFNGVIPSPELTLAQVEPQLELLMTGIGRGRRA